MTRPTALGVILGLASAAVLGACSPSASSSARSDRAPAERGNAAAVATSNAGAAPAAPALTRNAAAPEGGAANGDPAMNDPRAMTEADWKKVLTPAQFYVLRNKGTERAFSGKYWNTFEKGFYRCTACKEPLFASDQKFNSECGWPSFSAEMVPGRITETRDTSHGMLRTEVTCPVCGSHLGHIFDDGPPPTHMRYCINSESIEFVPAAEAAGELKKYEARNHAGLTPANGGSKPLPAAE